MADYSIKWRVSMGLLALLAGLVGAAPAYAQGWLDATHHEFGVGVGLERLALRDDHASPLQYTGWKNPLELSHSYSGQSLHHWLSGSYRQGRLRSVISEGHQNVEKVWEWHIRHQLTLGFTGPNETQLGAGIAFEAAVRNRDHLYVEGIQERFILSVFTLGPLVRGWLPLSQQANAEVWLALPAAAVVVRSPYAVKGVLDYRLKPVGRFFRLMPGVAGQWQVSEQLTLRTSFEARYSHIREPFQLREMQKTMVVRLLWRPL